MYDTERHVQLESEASVQGGRQEGITVQTPSVLTTFSHS